jgi:lysozyme
MGAGCRNTIHNAMNIDKIRKDLIRDEGMILRPYFCPAGFLTVGVGRNLEGNGLSVGEMVALIRGDERRLARFPKDFESLDGEILFTTLVRDMKLHGISTHEAMMLLDNDIYECTEQLHRRLKWFEAAPAELQEVLVNMCFNMGIRTLMTFRNTLFLMSVGEYERAAVNMLKSRWARQVKARAQRLAERVRAIND